MPRPNPPSLPSPTRRRFMVGRENGEGLFSASREIPAIQQEEEEEEHEEHRDATA